MPGRRNPPFVGRGSGRAWAVERRLVGRLLVIAPGLAQTHARQANDTQALQILAAARAKRPGHYLLEYYFGLLASRLGRDQEAVDALKQAANWSPTLPILLLNSARSMRRRRIGQRLDWRLNMLSN